MMKYIYATMAAAGFLIGIFILFTGNNQSAILTLIFGAVCAAAAEVNELSEKLTKKDD